VTEGFKQTTERTEYTELKASRASAIGIRGSPAMDGGQRICRIVRRDGHPAFAVSGFDNFVSLLSH
jgi:hypothetical protein